MAHDKGTYARILKGALPSMCYTASYTVHVHPPRECCIMGTALVTGRAENSGIPTGTTKPDKKKHSHNRSMHKHEAF